MASSLANGAPTFSKSWTQFTDNIGLIYFSFIIGLLLSPVFWFYPMSMAFVNGKYPSLKSFQALVFTKKFIIASLLGWMLFIIPILGILAIPFYSHYIFTTDGEPLDLMKKSLDKLFEVSNFIGKTILYYAFAFFGLCFCFIGQFFTIPLVNIHVYNEVVNIIESESKGTHQKPR